MEKEIKINVQKMFKDGRIVKLDEKSSETVDVLRIDPEANYGKIGTDRSYTHSWPGSYCSAKASVWMESPCLVDEEQQKEAYQCVSDFCEEMMAKTIRELKESCEEKNPKLRGR